MSGINRERSQRARRRPLGWCDTCDAALVGEYGRCSICGRKRDGKIKCNSDTAQEAVRAYFADLAAQGDGP